MSVWQDYVMIVKNHFISKTKYLLSMGQLSRRSIRTFVLRQGRLTEGQQRSLDLHWSDYGIDVNPKQGEGNSTPSVENKAAARSSGTEGDELHDSSTRVVRDDSPDVDRIDVARRYPTAAPLWMEIGIGNGDALVTMAGQNPSVNFLGVEVHLPGIGHALGEVAQAELSNVRLIRYDVLDLIEHYMQPSSVDRVLIYFPDPWHKSRHHKRRLVSEKFLNMLTVLLRPGGMIHFATDWVPYAEQVKLLVAEHSGFELMPTGEEANAVTQLRPETHFERRGLKLGHKVTDLVIIKS